MTDLKGSGWDFATERASESEGDGIFLRIEDGEEAKVIFAGKPFVFATIWNNEEKRSERFDEDKHDGKRPRWRYRINVLNLSQVGEDDPAVQILEMGARLFKKLDEMREEVGLDRAFKLKRKGSGKKTEYSLIGLKELTKDQLEKRDATQLLELDPDKASPAGDDDGEDVASPW